MAKACSSMDRIVPDDEPYLDLAIEVGAEFLVTRDRDFLLLWEQRRPISLDIFHQPDVPALGLETIEEDPPAIR
jgi:hypothetical protein